MNAAVSNARLEADLASLGVHPGGVLLVHTSFRRVMPVEGGPLGLIAALGNVLGSEGTLVMPTMTDGESVFDPRTTPTCEMGITAELFWRQHRVVRSTHPGGSFAARGPLAETICAPHPLSPPHGRDSPPGRVLDADGQVLLLGVGYSECTMLHVAEDIAGVPYSIEHPCVVDNDGVATRVMVAETDHCCRGFGRMEGWLGARGMVRRRRVGHASAILVSARDLVAVAVQQLREDPLCFLCPPGTGCSECEKARASVR
jgi:aminoglycoside 3-N-acetyltransferase